MPYVATNFNTYALHLVVSRNKTTITIPTPKTLVNPCNF